MSTQTLKPTTLCESSTTPLPRRHRPLLLEKLPPTPTRRSSPPFPPSSSRALLFSNNGRRQLTRDLIVGQVSSRSRRSPPAENHEANIGTGANTTLELMKIDNLVDGALIDISVADGNHSASFEHDRVLLVDIYGRIKFAILFVLLSFQGSPQAAAVTELTTGIQPFNYIGDLGDTSTGFVSAFLLIFFSELGDKTFFIAALLAARNSGAIVFTGTFGALAAMTVVSVIIGRTFHYVDGILPFRFGETDLPIDDIAAVCLLVYFGVSTLLDAASGDSIKVKEEQKEAELVISELSGNGTGIVAAASTVISTFLLVFVAEWGDKSFFSTIALAAASSPLGVIGGALAGHAVATLLAVLGGSLLGTFLSDKVIAYVGGSLFLVFAFATLLEIVS